MSRLPASALLVLTAWVGACGKTPDVPDTQRATVRSPAAIDYNRNVGWLHGNCLAIRNPDLPPGTPLTIVQPDQPPSVTTATVAARARSEKTCKALIDDRRKINIEGGYTFYAVVSKPEINLGIGVVGDTVRPTDYRFDYCSTREGVMFTLKARPEQGGAELWKGYYYLGYDTDVTCPGERSDG